MPPMPPIVPYVDPYGDDPYGEYADAFWFTTDDNPVGLAGNAGAAAVVPAAAAVAPVPEPPCSHGFGGDAIVDDPE